jgi:hypothetical protein
MSLLEREPKPLVSKMLLSKGFAVHFSCVDLLEGIDRDGEVHIEVTGIRMSILETTSGFGVTESLILCVRYGQSVEGTEIEMLKGGSPLRLRVGSQEVQLDFIETERIKIVDGARDRTIGEAIVIHVTRVLAHITCPEGINYMVEGV